jgi:hypothetical protein
VVQELLAILTYGGLSTKPSAWQAAACDTPHLDSATNNFRRFHHEKTVLCHLRHFTRLEPIRRRHARCPRCLWQRPPWKQARYWQNPASDWPQIQAYRNWRATTTINFAESSAKGYRRKGRRPASRGAQQRLSWSTLTGVWPNSSSRPPPILPHVRADIKGSDYCAAVSGDEQHTSARSPGRFGLCAGHDTMNPILQKFYNTLYRKPAQHQQSLYFSSRVFTFLTGCGQTPRRDCWGHSRRSY